MPGFEVQQCTGLGTRIGRLTPEEEDKSRDVFSIRLPGTSVVVHGADIHHVTWTYVDRIRLPVTPQCVLVHTNQEPTFLAPYRASHNRTVHGWTGLGDSTNCGRGLPGWPDGQWQGAIRMDKRTVAGATRGNRRAVAGGHPYRQTDTRTGWGPPV